MNYQLIISALLFTFGGYCLGILTACIATARKVHEDMPPRDSGGAAVEYAILTAVVAAGTLLMLSVINAGIERMLSR